jgi:GntR family transcriptional repressor for pyruvate dehydrogenase complex
MARRAASVGLRAGIGPMSRQKVADQILSALRTEIVTGTLPRGSRLPAERDLAEQFGVSGPTVREAIRGLSALGLVEVRHGSGAYVAPNVDSIVAVSLGTLVQLEDVGVEDLIRLLSVLHGYAGRLAVERASEEDLARLRAAAEATATGETVDDTADALIQFLTVFVEAAHDRLLAALTRFLVHLVVELEISSHERESDEFWRQWSASARPLRLKMAESLERRDAAALAVAVSEYHDGVTGRIRMVPALRDARLSDPALSAFLARVVADSTRP